MIPAEQKENDRKDFYTPSEVAKMLQLHTSTVRKRFANVPGVIDLSVRGNSARRGKQPHRTLRIPREVLYRYLHDHKIRG